MNFLPDLTFTVGWRGSGGGARAPPEPALAGKPKAPNITLLLYSAGLCTSTSTTFLYVYIGYFAYINNKLKIKLQIIIRIAFLNCDSVTKILNTKITLIISLICQSRKSQGKRHYSYQCIIIITNIKNITKVRVSI